MNNQQKVELKRCDKLYFGKLNKAAKNGDPLAILILEFYEKGILINGDINQYD